MKHAQLSLAALLLAATLTACGGSGSAPATNPNPSPAPGATGTVTHSGLAACPSVSVSEDLAATNCLKGKVVGKTLSGDDCTFTVGDNPFLTYASKNSSFTYTITTDVYSNFNHVPGQYVIWSFLDTSPSPDLDVMYAYNFHTRQLQIDTSHQNVKSTCVAKL